MLLFLQVKMFYYKISGVCLVSLVGTILFLTVSTLSKDVDPSLLCSSSSCDGVSCKPPQEHCTAKNETHDGIFMLSPTLCNCCQYCLVYLYEGDDCTNGSLGSPPTGSVCGPGLSCQGETDETTCQRMKTECHDLQDSYDERRANGSLGSLEIRPECDEDGDFKPVVCVPGLTCFCRNKKGDRIFGEILNENSAAAKMNCECSVEADKTANLLGDLAHSRRCKEDGSFDLLQCVGNRCFCLNPETGSLGSPKVIDLTSQALTVLPCFDKNIHHNNRSYLRECEELKMEMIAEVKEAELEGFSFLGNPIPNCQPDGNFGKIARKGDKKICVDPQGKQIQDFGEIETDASNEMNCNCARTYALLQKAKASYVLPNCCSNGNWRPMQCYKTFCYCVDQDGIQIPGEEADIDNVDILSCSSKSC